MRHFFRFEPLAPHRQYCIHCGIRRQKLTRTKSLYFRVHLHKRREDFGAHRTAPVSCVRPVQLDLNV